MRVAHRLPGGTALALCAGMIVDKKSLIDLGVLPSPTGEWPLRKLLDHTHSDRAALSLLSLLANPLGDIESIRRRQSLLQGLPAALQHVSWNEFITLAFKLETYLDSNYINCPESLAEFALFSLRYGDIVNFVEPMVLAASAFVEMCARLYVSIAALECDSAFREHVIVLRTLSENPLRDELQVASAPSRSRQRKLCALDRRVRIGNASLLRNGITAFHAIDAFHSLALAANTLDYTLPIVTDDIARPLYIAGLRHPLFMSGVDNNFSLRQAERVVFLTGPNMAGKSTAMRSIGVAFVFAHLGLSVPASRAEIPLVQRLIASLSAEDSVLRGESLYLSEVRRVKTVVASVVAGETLIALLDEVFRGTNARDAGEATTLLVQGLARADRGIFVVASHLVEVVDVLGTTAGVGFWCMAVRHLNNKHAFTYILERGVSSVRLGMALLESEGVVSLLSRIGSISSIGSATPVAN